MDAADASSRRPPSSAGHGARAVRRERRSFGERRMDAAAVVLPPWDLLPSRPSAVPRRAPAAPAAAPPPLAPCAGSGGVSASGGWMPPRKSSPRRMSSAGGRSRCVTGVVRGERRRFGERRTGAAAKVLPSRDVLRWRSFAVRDGRRARSGGDSASGGWMPRLRSSLRGISSPRNGRRCPAAPPPPPRPRRPPAVPRRRPDTSRAVER
jgi:hypothetical protein